MSKFKVGDEVVVTSNALGCGSHRLGKTGIVTSTFSHYSVHVKFAGEPYSVFYYTSELTLASEMHANMQEPLQQGLKPSPKLDTEVSKELKALLAQTESRGELETSAVLRYLLAKGGF